jgi:hypothetical protein
MSYEKVYIGKGTQVPNLPITKLTLKVEEILKVAYERDGVKYVTLEVAQLKEPDKFGRTYTCYASVKTTEVNEPAPQRASGKRKRREKSEELPF